MNKENFPATNILDLIDKEKINLVIKRFVDVLKINIFLVTPDGQALIMPYSDRYGWKLLANSPIGNKIFKNQSIQLNQFTQQGQYREFQSQLDFHNFALPIIGQDKNIIGYLVVGPVLLTKRRPGGEYEQIAHNLGLSSKELTDSINEIRVVSHVDMKSIIDLLDEVVRYSLQTVIEHRRLTASPSVPALESKITSAQPDIETAGNITEVLKMLLDIALSITKAECGSVMILDEKTGELKILISKGLTENFKSKPVKVGEGIAGIAAKDNASFLIHGTKTDNNRIKPLLTRSEIKHSLVTPITAQDRVRGVLNVHTKNEHAALTGEDLNTVQMLSRLTAAAFGSAQKS